MQVGIVAEQLRHEVPGGIGTYAAGLLAGLVALDDRDVTAVALASRAPSDDPLAQAGVPVMSTRWPHRVQMALWDATLSRPPAGLDVLHRTSLAGPAARAGTPSTVMVHDLGWRRNPELTTARGRRWHEAALRRTIASEAVLIVPSDVIAADLEGAGVAGRRIHVIGEGADHLPAPDRGAAEVLRRQLGVPDEFLLTVSTLEPRKNLAALVAAHSELSARMAVPPLLIAGPAGWGDVTVGTTDRVILAGAVSPAILAALYATCSLFVSVPVHEGFGLPPLEAMAHGAPVVASTAVPSMQGAPVVAAVDADSITSIALGIEGALLDSEAREVWRERGLRHAERARWVDVAAAHVALWRSLP